MISCTPTFTDQIFSQPFFASFTDNFFSRWLGYLDVAIAKNSRNCMSWIFSTRLHVSFANFSWWLHLNNLVWFYKRGKCQWNLRGICHIFATIFAKWIATDGWRTFLSVKVGWHDFDLIALCFFTSFWF